MSEHLAGLVHGREAAMTVADDDLEAALLIAGLELHALDDDFRAIVRSAADLFATDATVEEQQAGHVRADQDVVDRLDGMLLQILGDDRFDLVGDGLAGLDEETDRVDCLHVALDEGLLVEHVKVAGAFETEIFGADVGRCHWNDLSVVGCCPVETARILARIYRYVNGYKPILT